MSILCFRICIWYRCFHHGRAALARWLILGRGPRCNSICSSICSARHGLRIYVGAEGAKQRGAGQDARPGRDERRLSRKGGTVFTLQGKKSIFAASRRLYALCCGCCAPKAGVAGAEEVRFSPTSLSPSSSPAEPLAPNSLGPKDRRPEDPSALSITYSYFKRRSRLATSCILRHFSPFPWPSLSLRSRSKTHHHRSTVSGPPQAVETRLEAIFCNS